MENNNRNYDNENYDYNNSDSYESQNEEFKNNEDENVEYNYVPQDEPSIDEPENASQEQPKRRYDNYSGSNTHYENTSYAPQSSCCESEPSRGFAISSMVLGILSIIICCCIEYVSLILGILAIVFYAVDRKRNGKSSGMAIAGLICGIIGTSLSALSILLTVTGVLEKFVNMYFPEYDSSFNGGTQNHL